MKFSELGKTGAYVSRLCLGAMTFGGSDTPVSKALGRLSQADTDVIVGSAIDSGINLIDTADVYGGGSSEVQLGEALKGRRNSVLLATKLHARVGPGPNQVGQSRLHIMEALEASLRRLGTEHIDLYQVHGFDPLTPLEETIRALDDVVRQGKVRYIGCSNFAAWQLVKALSISEHERASRFVSIQSFYSLACRDIEAELVPAVLDSRTGLLCWSPLAGGLLSGKFDKNGTTNGNARRNSVRFPPVDEAKAFRIVTVLKAIATKHSATPSQVALAWLLAQRHVASVIVGVKRADQLLENLAAVDLALDSEDLTELDRVSRQPPTYPGWIATYNAKARIPQGNTFEGQSWSLGEEPL